MDLFRTVQHAAAHGAREGYLCGSVARSEIPSIRQFDVPEHYDFNSPCETTESSKWESVRHETILRFTAVGFFFAKELYETYSVPIGLIKTAIGGAQTAAWMGRESLKEYPDLIRIADRFGNGEYVKRLMQREDIREKQWYEQLNRADLGMQSGKLNWQAENYDDSDWKTMRIPSYWADEGLA